MNKILFSSFSLDELNREIKTAFEEMLGRKLDDNISSIEGCIDGIDFEIPSNKVEQDRAIYLTRHEVCKLLKISLPTLHRYTRDSILKSYRIGGKVRYKREEVENSLKERNFNLSKKGGRHA